MLRRNDILYPELSYKIVGVLFEVFNQLGPGLKESSYQKSVAIGLRKIGLRFKEQVLVNLEFHGQKVGYYFLDFVIEDKIVLELKRGDAFLKTNLNQVLEYLKASNLKLGIIANFTNSGLKFKRIINLENS